MCTMSLVAILDLGIFAHMLGYPGPGYLETVGRVGIHTLCIELLQETKLSKRDNEICKTHLSRLQLGPAITAGSIAQEILVSSLATMQTDLMILV